MTQTKLSDKAQANRVIYNVVKEELAGHTTTSDLIVSMYSAQRVGANARIGNQYMADALAWSLVDVFNIQGKASYIAHITDIIVHSDLRNEVKRTMKVALQRATLVVSDKQQKLVIDEKGGTLNVELEDVIEETKLDKAIKGLAKTAVKEGANITALTDLLKHAFQEATEQAEKAGEKKTSKGTGKLPSIDPSHLTKLMMDQTRRWAGVDTEVKTRKAVNA